MIKLIFRVVPFVLSILSCSFAALAGEIREFSIPTLERLGNELSRRDSIAARASDAVLETQPAAKTMKMRGWITELGGGGDKVHLIAETPSGPVLAYTVTFRGGKPQVEDRHGQPLPANVALRYKARNTAAAAVRDKLFDVSYNFEVLNDPDGNGFLVYALAATKKKGEILTGGHYRVTVSSDGSKAKRVDLLSQLIRQKADAGHDTVAVVCTQLVSNVPVETWLYSSYLYHMPMYVGTMDKALWRVVNGKIHKFTKAELDAMDKKEKKK